mgnify:CR=1 FL=1
MSFCGLALLLAWMNVIVSEGLHDRAYVEKHGHGFDAFAAAFLFTIGPFAARASLAVALPLPFGIGTPHGTRVIKAADHEKPNGEWNTIELYCVGDEAVHGGTLETWHVQPGTAVEPGTVIASLRSPAGVLGNRATHGMPRPAVGISGEDGAFLLNPYGFMFEEVTASSLVKVDESGNPVTWMIEGGSPNALVRRGVTKASIPVGSELIVTGYQARDGSNKAVGRDIAFADGRELFFEGSRAPGADKATP